MYIGRMNIEYDPAKNDANIKEHGIDLADVEGVFYDPCALTIEDRDHDEQRFVVLGSDGFQRILVVCYTYREPETIRIISARKAEPQERKHYGG